MTNSTETTTASNKPTVIEALRRFLPAYLRTSPVLSVVQRRAIWAIQHCRTAMLGGSVYACADCDQRHFAYHSCNNKVCPQCGRGATAQWIERQQAKRVSAPYFMVTFTLPSELRPLFFGASAKDAYDAFFAASSLALKEQLANPRHLGATTSGYSMVLHSWNQQLLVHPHIHCIVPGAGLDAQGNYVEVKNAKHLVPVAALRAALRHHFGQQLKARGIDCDPSVWRLKWGVHVQPFGNSDNAIKYLGRYVSRSVIGDSRIVSISDRAVKFRWKDRAHGDIERISSIPGEEFVRRYLRHVLPDKLRGIRHYGFHHPAAKESRQRVRMDSAARNGKVPPRTSSNPPTPATESATEAQVSQAPEPKAKGYPCPCCAKPMRWLYTLPKGWLVGLDPSLGPRPPPSAIHQPI